MDELLLSEQNGVLHIAVKENAEDLGQLRMRVALLETEVGRLADNSATEMVVSLESRMNTYEKRIRFLEDENDELRAITSGEMS